MFYYLDGTVSHIEPSIAVIDCGGVGYLCHVTTQTQSELKVGERGRLYTHLNVREDIFELYGFHSLEEKDCFLLLTGISGVGMKAGLSILSTLTPEKFALAVLSGEERQLCNAPGIGKKLAQRIILELKDKMKKQFSLADKSISQELPIQTVTDTDKCGEAIMAMQVLGYSAAEASHAMKGIDCTELGVEEIIRQALKNMGKKA